MKPTKLILALFLLPALLFAASPPTKNAVVTNYTVYEESVAGVPVAGLIVKSNLHVGGLEAGKAVFTDANTNLTTAVTPSWFPNYSYEVWYEPFQGGDVAAGTIGSLGWQQQSTGVGGGSINFSNSVGHAGVCTLSSSSSANSIQTLFNSDAPNNKPTIFPLNNSVGWTNRIIWRLVNTNDCKIYIGFIGNANFTQSALENSVAIFYNGTNSNQIMGHTSAGSVVTTTNLGVIQQSTWNTNEIWSHVSGTIFFSLNNGPTASISATIPTTSVTPAASVVKQILGAGLNATLELDEWLFIWSR